MNSSSKEKVAAFRNKWLPEVGYDFMMKMVKMLDQHAEEARAEHDQWISTTDRQPPSLEPGHFRKYLVSCNGLVFECSWLFGGWHKHHDGCSECHPDAWQYMPTPYQEKSDD